YARELAGWLGMDESSVRQAVMRAARHGGGRGGIAGAHRNRGASASRAHSAGGHGFPAAADDAQGTIPRARGEGRPDGAAQRGASAHSTDPVTRLEGQVLEVVLQLPDHAHAAAFDTLGADTFTVPAYRAVHDAIRASGGVSAYQARYAELSAQ